MAKITKTIEQPDEVIKTFADRLGYQELVVNPDYVPAQGSETIQDPDWVKPEDFDEMTDTIPQVPNPDYVAAVGEKMMTNPQSRVDFVSEKFDAMASNWFAQFARRDAERDAEQLIRTKVEETKAAIKASITTT